MTPFAAVTGVQAVAALLAAIAAAAVLVLPPGRARTRAMPLALALAVLAVLAVAEDQVCEQVSGRLAPLGVAAAAGLVGLAVLAAVFRRWPAAFVLAALVALPFRIPVAVGGQTANLLLPLYAVIAGGVLATLVGGGDEDEDEAAAGGTRGLVPGLTLERALAAVVVLYAAQALYSTDVEAATKDIAFFDVPFVVLFRLLVDVPWTRRLVRAAFATVVALAAVFAVVGLYQYATRTLFFDNEKVLLANELKPYFRVNSLFFDPNIYGRFLALAMVLVAAAMLWAPRRRAVWACAAVLALLWAGLVPSLSESSFASLALGLIVLAGLRWRWRPVFAAAVLAGAVAIAVAIIAPSAVGIDTGSFDQLNRSTSGRAELVRGGLRMARDRPVAGLGSGSFAERYRAREHLLSPRSPAESHTIPVTVAAEQGVIGLAAYLLLALTAFTVVLRGGRDGPARAGVAAAFAALFLHTLVYAAFLEDPMTWALLAAAVALRRPGAAAGPELAESAAARTARPRARAAPA